jgi:hypothetical protein
MTSRSSSDKGMDSHLAYKASIMLLTISILFSSERLMKLVSTIIRYGGTRASL